MNELTVTKYNESYIKCTSEDLGLLQSLSDFFTFQVPGASFMPSVRARRWDGKIRMFSKATGKIYYEDEKGNRWDLIEVFHNIVLMSKEIVRLRKITNKKFVKLVKCIDEAFNKKIVIQE